MAQSNRSAIRFQAISLQKKGAAFWKKRRKKLFAHPGLWRSDSTGPDL
jgi:hypothetical protein